VEKKGDDADRITVHERGMNSRFSSRREPIRFQLIIARNDKLDTQNCWYSMYLQLFFNNILAQLRIRDERLRARKLFNHWLIAVLNRETLTYHFFLLHFFGFS
jgi:hypothetical protein